MYRIIVLCFHRSSPARVTYCVNTVTFATPATKSGCQLRRPLQQKRVCSLRINQISIPACASLEAARSPFFITKEIMIIPVQFNLPGQIWGIEIPPDRDSTVDIERQDTKAALVAPTDCPPARPPNVSAPRPNAPPPNCLAQFATNTRLGQSLADDGTKLVSGLTFDLGIGFFATAAFTTGTTSAAAFGGVALAALGVATWGVSTTLSASARPADESLATHIVSSAKTAIFGFCICCCEFCLGCEVGESRPGIRAGTTVTPSSGTSS